MPDNILKAVISVTAPGAQQAFQGVQDGAKKTEGSLISMKTSLSAVDLTLKEQRTLLVSLKQQYAALSTEQARGTIGKELAADIGVANQEIKRLEAGATNSFASIGSAATKGFSAVRRLAQILPGIGVAGIFSLAISGLQELLGGLTDLGGHFTEAQLKASAFKDELDSIKEAADQLKDALDFQNKLSSLQFKIKNGEGLASDIHDLNDQFKENQVIISSSTKTLDTLNEKFIGLAKSAEAFKNASKNPSPVNSTELGGVVTGPTAFQQLLQNGKDITRITSEQLKELSSKQQQFVTEYQETYKALNETDKTRQKALQENSIIQLQIQLANADNQREVDEKTLKENKAAYEKYLKQLEEQRKSLIRFNELIRNSLEGIKFEIPPDIIRKNASETGDLFAKDIHDYFNNPDNFDVSLDALLTKLRQTRTDNLKLGLTVKINPQFDADEFRTSMQKATDYINAQFINVVTEFKNNLANAIGEGIGNALSGGGFGSLFAGIFSAVGQALQEFGKTLIAVGIGLEAIKAAFKSLNPAIALAAGIGLVALGAVVKNSVGKIGGFRAEGGPVSGGVSYVVGERGPEIFVPNIGGNIIPNHKLGSSVSGIQGGGGGNHKVTFEIAGQTLVGVLTLANQSMARLS